MADEGAPPVWTADCTREGAACVTGTVEGGGGTWLLDPAGTTGVGGATVATATEAADL